MSRRMFNDTIVESDAFLEMPLTAQALYFHLGMNADSEGFVNPKRIVRMIGAAEDDLRILIAKRFLLAFDSGVVVIKHWWINNQKRLDRLAPTNYQNELAQLQLKNNRAYTEKSAQLALETGEITEVGNQMATNRQPLVASKQSKVIQSNSIQTNGSGNRPPTAGFVKTITTAEQKRSYAKAAQADRDQEVRAEGARGRKGSTSSLSELYRQRRQGKDVQ